MKAHIYIYHSKMDKAGNCYWFFRYYDVASGKTVVGKISGGESNIRAIPLYMGDKEEWPAQGEYQVSIHELKIREFDRETKNMEYAGCESKKLAEFIKSKLT
jgi:hypothetical protein